MWNRFAWTLAARHLRFGIAQTLLTVGVVAISVTLIIFLRSLVGGLQKRLIETVTGSVPQIVIEQPRRAPLTPWSVGPMGKGPESLYTGKIPTLEQQKREITEWQQVIPIIRNYSPEITAVSPVAEGDGFLYRGENREAVSITGMIPELENKVVDIQSALMKGKFFGLQTGDVVVGYKIADDLALSIGDKVRITSSEGVSEVFTVRGIFNTGYQSVDYRTVFVPLSDGQSLFNLQRAVTSIGIRLKDVFEANNVSRGLRLKVPYDVKSWMEENQTLLAALRNQTQTTTLIMIFTVVAAGFGIASILITAVTSKLQEIGILKAIGATPKQILGIFTLESTLMAFLGGIVGVALGVGLSILAYQYRLATSPIVGKRSSAFPIDLSPELLLGAFFIAIIIGFFASLYPARRAASINPIEVIRGV